MADYGLLQNPSGAKINTAQYNVYHPPQGLLGEVSQAAKLAKDVSGLLQEREKSEADELLADMFKENSPYNPQMMATYAQIVKTLDAKAYLEKVTLAQQVLGDDPKHAVNFAKQRGLSSIQEAKLVAYEELQAAQNNFREMNMDGLSLYALDRALQSDAYKTYGMRYPQEAQELIKALAPAASIAKERLTNRAIAGDPSAEGVAKVFGIDYMEPRQEIAYKAAETRKTIAEAKGWEAATKAKKQGEVQEPATPLVPEFGGNEKGQKGKGKSEQKATRILTGEHFLGIPISKRRDGTKFKLPDLSGF